MREKVVIIGSGPAGFSAAIYAARANLSPLLFEGTAKPEMIPLGQLAFTTEIENYPGFPAGNVRPYVESAVDAARHWNLPPAPNLEKGDQPHSVVQGIELMELMRQQACNFGTRIVSDDIVDVDLGQPLKAIPASGVPVETHAIIVATGARANYLGLESETRYKNRGVSACAVCDGALPIFRGQKLAVIGGGDSAVEEATYLANLKDAATIYLVHRRDALRASKIMQQRAFDHPKIEILWNRVVEEVLGDGTRVKGLRLRDPNDGSTSELSVGGMFVAIGHTPNTAFLRGKVAMNAQGYIQWTRPFRTHTSVEGIFAAGDVADDHYRQAITAAGSGCMAALDAERYLGAKEFEADL